MVWLSDIRLVRLQDDLRSVRMIIRNNCPVLELKVKVAPLRSLVVRLFLESFIGVESDVIDC